MAHVFDSGLADTQRGLVRRAVLAGMAELRRSVGGYVAALLQLAVPITFGTEEEQNYFRDQVAGQSPVVAVALGGRDFAAHGTGDTEWHGPITVHVYCCSSAKRSHAARLEGDVVSAANNQADPGVEVMAEHVLQLLAGRQMRDHGGGILRPQREAIVFFGAEYTVLEQVYQLDMVTDVNPNRALLEVLESVDGRHTDTDAPLELRAVSEVSA